jgi:hypothetical protein
MKYSLFVVFLLVGISHGLFGPVGQIVGNIGNVGNVGNVGNIGDTIQSGINGAGQTAGNLLNDVKDQVEKVIYEIINAANGIQFAANFLWDNVFSPALDMMLQGKLYLESNIKDNRF